jgi:hypothetical protein
MDLPHGRTLVTVAELGTVDGTRPLPLLKVRNGPHQFPKRHSPERLSSSAAGLRPARSSVQAAGPSCGARRG